jgi:NAD(P)-dependent dehydrogenase (short-subunit alcohol dehydrogenase family)
MGIELKGRVTIVTDDANGIGRTTSLAFVRAAAAGQAVTACFKVKVASQAGIDAAVKAVLDCFGQIDILINNVGNLRDAPLVKVKDGEVVGQMSEADFDNAADHCGRIQTRAFRDYPLKVRLLPLKATRLCLGVSRLRIFTRNLENARL